jgi:peptide/nickel transport system substrate-binding protein
MKPISGFDPNKGMLLVRNPNYNPSTDSKTVRENLLDGVDIAVDSNTADIFNKIEQGSLDGIWQGTHVPSTFVQRVQSGAAPNVTLHDNPDDGIYYFSMNLLTPPFDDVHVRKAVNWAMDKAQLQKVVGGPLHGAIATHIFPPSVLSYPGYNPYPTPGSAGDVSKAQAEMKLSKYDPKHDGMCDVPACKNVFMLSCSDSPDCAAQEPVIQASLAKIGITFRVRELTSSAAYNLAQGVKNLVPFYVSGGWVKDYPDPFTYIVLFQSSSIICTGASNYSNIGMTAAQAKQCGVTSEWQKAKPTSLDANITHCARLSSSARADCWRAFDRTVMQDVVPWVPWRWSNTITPTYKTVTKFEFDQNAALPSFVHIAVNNGIDPNTLSL